MAISLGTGKQLTASADRPFMNEWMQQVARFYTFSNERYYVLCVIIMYLVAQGSNKNSFKKLKQHNTHTTQKEHKNLKNTKKLQSQRIYKRRPY